MTSPATISASLVKELRDRTGAGMMECKKALAENNGNIDAAIEAMRKSGQAKADKKSGRVAAEGIIVIRISDNAKHAVIVEINCETDFVARDQNFLHFANSVAEHALTSKANDLESLLQVKLHGHETVDDARKSLIAKIGENIQVRRFKVINTDHHIAGYTHGGRIGALVVLNHANNELAKDLAMHIVASHPLVVNPTDVPSDVIAKEKEIFSAQATQSGKPANIIEKMIEGRIKKFLDEVSLLGQPFVKDPEITVGKMLDKHKAQVIEFARFAVGEGIEKQTVNFAEEVMAQVKGS